MSDPAAIIAAQERQRMEALEKANAVRDRNAKVKRLLRDRKIDPYELIGGTLPDPDVATVLEEAIRSWPVSRLLRAVPGCGEAKTAQILMAFGGSPRVKVSALSYQRRAELARLARAAVLGR